MDDRAVREFRMQMKLLQRRLHRELVSVAGVSRSAVGVLGAVARLPEGVQPRQLADELQMTSSNVAAALRELEAGGLISREKDLADARRVLVFLTDRGNAVVASSRNERDTWLGQAMEALDEDEQRVLLAAGRLMQRLAETASPASVTLSSSASDRS
ncbi:MAG: MarR family transcriptional regulator [Actinomycetota bacterium]|nr:MarR family transcriptional regulator [Actinomycetota bacterium]